MADPLTRRKVEAYLAACGGVGASETRGADIARALLDAWDALAEVRERIDAASAGEGAHHLTDALATIRAALPGEE